MSRFICLTALCFSVSAFAEIASLEIFGNFVNTQGCRAFMVNCAHFVDAGESYNNCSFELYVDGEYVAGLGKEGEIIKTEGDRIVARDRGLRSMGSRFGFANTTAEFKVNETYVDPSTFPETSVYSFDLVIKEGLFGNESANCKDMRPE